MIDYLRDAISVACGVAALILIARQLEKRWPIDPNLSRSEIISDLKVTGTNIALVRLVGPFTGASGAAIVTAAGGGFIHLRTDGWRFGVSLLVVVLALDLYRYGNHRLKHAVPFLWAMHSFHHSAEALTFITGARHHWLEQTIEGACFPILAILFKVPADLLLISGIISFLPDGCAHLNVRVPLGRAIIIVSSPQWHRIHHSTQPEHFNKNFAALLPLWDILFGTAWIPAPDEYPATGLVPGEKVGILASIVWPFRRYLGYLDGHVPTWPRLQNWGGMKRVYARFSGSHDA